MASLKQDCSPKSVAVIGGGVSGLAAAYKLKSHGLKVTLFEAEERVGGKLRSVSQEGLMWDEGANTMTESEPEVRSLLDNLGLREKQQFPISQNKRYIVRNAKPELIPTDPIQLIQSSFLSTMSKFHIILEPFLWRSSAKKSNSSDVSSEYKPDSVGDFFQRHFGKEVVDYLIDPFVAGSSAGDPDSLCMPYAFPEIWNLEKMFGSVIVGAIQSRLSGKKEKQVEKKTASGKRKYHRGSFSFQGGMQTLTDTLSKELGDDLELNSKVLSLSYNHDASPLPENWSLSYTKDQKQLSADLPFDAVIMTAPLSSAKEMKITREGIPFMLDFLPDVNYLPLSVIITTFKKEKVKRPLEGFGVLVPSKEQQNGLNTLGTLFSSMMFPDRAPSDVYLYTTFVGGSRNRELAKASLDELKQVVASDLSKLLGAEEQPIFIKRFYWSKAFPLYGHDYKSVLDGIEKMEESLPGFFYAGNHRGGLSVGKAIASGCKAADLVIAYLSSSNGNKLLEEAS